MVSLSAEAAESPCSHFGRQMAMPEMYPARAVHLSWSTSSALPPCDLSDPEFHLSTSLSSTSASKDSYLMDGEFYKHRAEIYMGLDSASEISIHLPYVQRTGGTFDGFIDSYHGWFSLPEGNREQIEKDSFVISGEKEDGQYFVDSRTGGRPGNIEMRLKRYWNFPELAIPLLLSELRISTPTSSDNFGHKGVDIATGLGLSKAFEQILFDANIALIYYSQPELGSLEFNRFHLATSLAFAYQISDSLQLRSNFLFNTENLSGIKGHPDQILYIDFGVSQRMNSTIAVELMLREDLYGGKGASDIAVLLGLRFF